MTPSGWFRTRPSAWNRQLSSSRTTNSLKSRRNRCGCEKRFLLRTGVQGRARCQRGWNRKEVHSTQFSVEPCCISECGFSAWMNAEFHCASRTKRQLLRPFIFKLTLGDVMSGLFALGGDGIFGSFCHAEFYNCLGFDLDGFASLRVTAHTGFAVRLHQTAEAGDDEDVVLFGFFDRGISEGLEECCGRFVVGSNFFG